MEDFSRRSLIQLLGLAGVAVGAGGLLTSCAQSPESLGAADGAGAAGILVAPPVANNLYWDGWVKAATAAAAALGTSPKVENFNGDTQAQLASFSNVPNLGLKGVMTMANVAASSPQLFGTLERQTTFGTNCHSNQPWSTPLDVGDHYVGYFDFPHQASFESLCTYLFDKMGGSGKIIHITGVQGVVASDFKDYAMDKLLAEKYPRIQLVARQPGNFGRVATVPVVENLLTAHPDVDAIICQNDDSALGAISVLKKKGLDKVLVVGADAIPEMLDAIVAGDALATVANPGEWMGGAMMVRLYDAINGFQVPPLERMQIFQTFVINTAEAAEAYKKVIAGPDPYDWKKMSRSLNPDGWDPQIPLKVIRPQEFWAAFEDKRPSGYNLPAAYSDASTNDYDAIDAMYAERLSNDVFAAVKKLNDPVVSVPLAR
ncbi:ABC-type sugar transport system substrate-binding protein [Arthrobacter sp. SLBN-100]|uniref:sugar ABC transporter substrate-binding protein n=1 Tax=Arthrobacter sp. SLBN-100 TaxID=2768450 RepID=UPI00115452B9|nr:sugar ABC transporter substrate-binding protein [Arthrobacter sp. SLBN-100]TQJ68417.1 ABC-type sugar transport system substrate-binding protein [Arthrobacter sp. SLBN-100]